MAANHLMASFFSVLLLLHDGSAADSGGHRPIDEHFGRAFDAMATCLYIRNPCYGGRVRGESWLL